MSSEVATFVCRGRVRTQGCNLISCECHQLAFKNWENAGRIVGRYDSVDENNVPILIPKEVQNNGIHTKTASTYRG